VALLVAAAFFMGNLDATIIVTATTAIARDLAVPPAATVVIASAYLVALAAAIPGSGWLARRFGARRIFLIGVVVFTLASLACALSGSLALLVVARVAQGAGASMMMPVGRLLVLQATDKRDLIHAIAYLTWPSLAAPLVAPLLGAVLAEQVGWPAIFLVNVPVGAALLLVGLRILPKEHAWTPEPFDVLGFLGVTVTIGGGLGAVELATSGENPLAAGLLLAVVVAVAAWTVRSLNRRREPFVDLSSFRVRSFRLSMTSGAAFRAAVTAVPFAVPLVLQLELGWSAVDAGVMLLWLFVGNLAIKPATTPLLRRFGYLPLAVAGGFGMFVTVLLVALIGTETPQVLTAGLLLASGVARSVGLTAYNTLQFSDIEGRDLAHANTLAESVNQLSGGAGVALVAVAVATLATGGGIAADPVYRGGLLAAAVVALASGVAAAVRPASRLRAAWR